MRFKGALCILILLGAPATYCVAQVPDHPIITEIFNNPPGSDGPTARDVTNPHQEFLELYLPTAGELNPALNKDALNLTYYEIEGDSANSQIGFVNQRFDLPTIDLDSTNGVTSGALERPSSGVVVLAWVDYDTFDPPQDLAGTPSTRVGLINNGITVSPAGVMFIAINGAEFTGTTNFPVPIAESKIDIPNDNVSGVFKNGSSAYLLVNRDDPGYVSLEDRSTGGDSFADLPGGGVLGLSALLDGIGGNDDVSFVESAQPYVEGTDIDLVAVLPVGGVFTPWVAQISEGSGAGYARRFVDVLRTTEDAIGGNEDPAFDATEYYRNVFNTGPFFPTPGVVVFSTSPPELGVPLANRLTFEVLANTTGRPGLLCANRGGNFPIDIAVTPGASSDPTVASFGTADSALQVLGQTEAFPQISVTVPASAPNGAIVSVPVTFQATNSSGGDPAVVNPVQGSTAVATVLNPTRALDAGGSPIETTVFAAVQGFGADPGVLNEFLESDLGAFAAANVGSTVGGSTGNLATLLDPGTDLEDILVVDPLRQSFPSSEASFINVLSSAGTDDLTTTLLTSAKVASGSSAYAASISTDQTAIRAIEFDIPETMTKGGTFSPSERLYFANATGGVNDKRSGLNAVTTSRTFELAIIDTNTTNSGIESGDADDFGVIVEVGQVQPGASVATGEFLFLSYSGGLEGEDIDTVDVPGINATDAILFDLDNLSDVLGVETITRVFVVDSGVGGTLNVMDVLSLARPPTGPCSPPDAPLADPSGMTRSRYLAVVPGATSGQTALEVTLSQVNEFGSFDGETRWVGAPFAAPDENSAVPGATIMVAPLSCEPYFANWSAIPLLHVFGAEIVPNSSYSIRAAAPCCVDAGLDTGCASAPLVAVTGKWGDILAPFDMPGGSSQPDFSDIAGVVSKFLASPDAPDKSFAQLQPNVEFPTRPIDFNDIAADVQAFLGTSYAASIGAVGPCTCPSSVVCGSTACSGDIACGDGYCVAGFCTDACARCRP